jgi:primase-polymerase (primpol)-like protein
MLKSIEGYDRNCGCFKNLQAINEWIEKCEEEIPRKKNENEIEWFERCMSAKLRPTPLVPILENIPRELRNIPNWLTWNYSLRWGEPDIKGRIKLWAKKPNARTDAPSTWCSFEKASKLYQQGGCDGIGFVFKKNCGIIGIDVDSAVGENGQPSKKLVKLLEKIGGFVELSVSGTGVHIYVAANIEGGARRDGIELYGSGHYFTVTGFVPNFAKDRRITDCQEKADMLFNALKSPKIIQKEEISEKTEKKINIYAQILEDYKNNKKFHYKPRTDEEVVAAMKNSRKDKVKSLINGDWQGLYQSQSDADFALLRYFYTYANNDITQGERLFRKSCMFRPDKERDIKYMTRKIIGDE